MSNSSAEQLPFRTRVLPVVVISDPQQAVPLAEALLEGGIDAMEITLRHPSALQGIERVAAAVPKMCVGAGTVTRVEELARVREAGVRFALSPGFTTELLAAARQSGLPFIPGVMTPAEVMTARDAGYTLLKLFPAAQAGGLSMLRALQGPLADMRFCPTGGVTPENMADFLREPNVAMVGGSWLAPLALVEAGDWAAITARARTATDAAK